MNFLKFIVFVLNLFLTLTLINGTIKKNDELVKIENKNEILNSNITESLFFVNQEIDQLLTTKNKFVRSIGSTVVKNTQKISTNNKQYNKFSKYKSKNPKFNKNKESENDNNESSNDFINDDDDLSNNDNKQSSTLNKNKQKENTRKDQSSNNGNENSVFEIEDNFDNHETNQNDENNKEDKLNDKRPEDRNKNAQKKYKQKKPNYKNKNPSSIDSGIESIDEDDSTNQDDTEPKSEIQANKNNDNNQRDKTSYSTQNKLKKPKKPLKKKVKDLVPLKSYEGNEKLRRPQKGTYGTRKEEKERIFKKFDFKINGENTVEFSSEHVFGNKVNLMGASVYVSREGKVGGAIEASGMAYYEQDSFHRMHVGTFSDGAAEDPIFDKSGMTPNEYRKFQQMAMREERPGDAIQINLIGYSVLPGFTSSATTGTENSQKNIKGIIANDSFFNMIKQNPPIYRLEGTRVVSQKLTRQEQVELIVARVIATDSSRFVAKKGEDPKEVWKTQVNKERAKARTFLDS